MEQRSWFHNYTYDYDTLDSYYRDLHESSLIGSLVCGFLFLEADENNQNILDKLDFPFWSNFEEE